MDASDFSWSQFHALAQGERWIRAIHAYAIDPNQSASAIRPSRRTVERNQFAAARGAVVSIISGRTSAATICMRSMLAKNGFAVLLVGTTALTLLSPLAEEASNGRAIIQAGFLALVFLSMHVSRAGRRGMTALWILIGAWLTTVILSSRYGSAAGSWVDEVIAVAVCLLVFFYVERSIMAAPVVDANVICGGIACYFLIAIAWALGFGLVERFAPGSIDWHKSTAPTLSDLMYFSLSCLTTLGFGDILPVRPFARMFSTLETVTGVIYLSVFVARLVSLYKR